MLVVQVSPNLERTTHCRTGASLVGVMNTVVRPDSVSTCTRARGAAGVRSSSHGDAGTSAGSEYRSLGGIYRIYTQR